MAYRNVIRATLACLLPCICAAAALANDSTATLESGVLRLTNSHDIAMEAEDLYLSVERVRVRYRFRNTANQDVVSRVAFPLPDILVGQDAEYSVGGTDPENFIDFRVEVDGVGVTPAIELRASVDGVDRTELLKRHRIHIAPFAEDFYPRLEAIPEAARAGLEQAGLVDWKSAFGTGNVPLPNPHWTAHVTFHWEQTFPAGRTVEVVHSYAPVPGTSFYGYDLLGDKRLHAAYCMDEGFLKSARRLFRKAPNGLMRELHYVLTTGANWKGAIGDFRVTIDKGKPENLVSLCIDGITRTGATTFEMRAKDFVPERDLKILVLEPHTEQ